MVKIRSSIKSQIKEDIKLVWRNRGDSTHARGLLKRHVIDYLIEVKKWVAGIGIATMSFSTAFLIRNNYTALGLAFFTAGLALNILSMLLTEIKIGRIEDDLFNPHKKPPRRLVAKEAIERNSSFML